MLISIAVEKCSLMHRIKILPFDFNSGVASLIIDGVYIHIFVFTDRKNNSFKRDY